MSLIKPIPPKMRAELADDPFMKQCCLHLVFPDHVCEGRVQWHHHLKFAGQRVNEKWCILPLCEEAHKKEALYKHGLDNIMVSRATEEELKPYCKAIDYIALRRSIYMIHERKRSP